MQEIIEKLESLKLSLPTPPQPVGNYKAYIVVGDLLYISGQMPLLDGKMKYTGKLGDDISIEVGQQAAQLSALNILSQVQLCTEQTGRQLKKVVKLEGYINATTSFTEHAAVLNGASNLISQVLNEKAGHIRTVIGCTSLPANAAVEISAIIELG